MALAAGRDASSSRREEETSLEKGCRRRATPRCDAYRPDLGRVMAARARLLRCSSSNDPSRRVDFVVAPRIQARDSA
jgi:hypothetical protein